jgi:hypothetical protein
MHLPAGLVLLVLIAACAPRQEERSPAEVACARQAEQVMADRNRSRDLWMDAGVAGPQTIIEDTAVIPRFDRQMDIVERDRLTRECLRRAEEQAQGRAQPGARPPAPPPQGWSLPPAILRW